VAPTLKDIICKTNISGKIQLEHGKRDQVTTMIFGTIGVTMELVIWNISKWVFIILGK